ncbi:MAG TPA: polysaccharide biosynthesis/export family protein [Caulobacteraceae bacterium]|nr:polysaccharide biosynthesis/export family protein [Caulobacteraceae bacterium]
MKGAAESQPYGLVNIDERVVQVLAAHPAQPLASLVAISSQAPNDIIQPGDVLEIGIYEPGAGPSLLGGSAAASEAAPAGGLERTGPALASQAMPRIIVDRDGMISIPFAGQVSVAGLTPTRAADTIRAALRGRAVNPQVIVSVLASPANSVTVIGEVKNSGRYPISTNSDRLLDVIAEAGGATHVPADTLITVSRQGQTASIPMDELMAGGGENIRLAPGDEVRVSLHQREVNALGALGRVSQFPIQDDTLTLAGALGRLGGLDTNSANASAVFLFRFERPEVAEALGVRVPGAPPGGSVPIVYRLNLRAGDGYFLANQFYVQANDLIDAPRANTTEIQKFFSIINASTATAVQASVISSNVP